MSNDDIIKNWKGSKKTRNTENPPPPNPIGDPELPDSELESVAGGTAGPTSSPYTAECCTTPGCPTVEITGCDTVAKSFD